VITLHVVVHIHYGDHVGLLEYRLNYEIFLAFGKLNHNISICRVCVSFSIILLAKGQSYEHFYVY
jgi:hypothetical protein